MALDGRKIAADLHPKIGVWRGAGDFQFSAKFVRGNFGQIHAAACENRDHIRKIGVCFKRNHIRRRRARCEFIPNISAGKAVAGRRWALGRGVEIIARNARAIKRKRNCIFTNIIARLRRKTSHLLNGNAEISARQTIVFVLSGDADEIYK